MNNFSKTKNKVKIFYGIEKESVHSNLCESGGRFRYHLLAVTFFHGSVSVARALRASMAWSVDTNESRRQK